VTEKIRLVDVALEEVQDQVMAAVSKGIKKLDIVYTAPRVTTLIMDVTATVVDMVAEATEMVIAAAIEIVIAAAIETVIAAAETEIMRQLPPLGLSLGRPWMSPLLHAPQILIRGQILWRPAHGGKK